MHSGHSGVADEVMAMEPLFHRSESGTTRADFDRLMDAAFHEVGASGRRYDRAFVLDELERRHREPVVERWQVSEFRCDEIAADTWLATYTLDQDGRLSRRATIWRRGPEGWKVLYHQGTLVAG
jgi:hypothetical protein